MLCGHMPGPRSGLAARATNAIRAARRSLPRSLQGTPGCGSTSPKWRELKALDPNMYADEIRAATTRERARRRGARARASDTETSVLTNALCNSARRSSHASRRLIHRRAAIASASREVAAFGERLRSGCPRGAESASRRWSPTLPLHQLDSTPTELIDLPAGSAATANGANTATMTNVAEHRLEHVAGGWTAERQRPHGVDGDRHRLAPCCRTAASPASSRRARTRSTRTRGWPGSGTTPPEPPRRWAP